MDKRILLVFILLATALIARNAKAAPGDCQVNITWPSNTTYTMSQNNTYYCLNQSWYVTTTPIQATNLQNSTLDCQGNTLYGSGSYGVYFNGANVGNNTIKNCNIVSFSSCIYLSASSNNKLINNTVNCSFYGIGMYTNSNNNTLINNRIKSNYMSVYLLSSYYLTMHNNTIQSNHDSTSQTTGLYVDALTTEEFRHDIDESNTINGLPIYYIDGVKRPCVNNAVYTNGSSYSYMAFVGCNNITVRDSSPTDGLMLMGTSNSLFTGLNISYTEFPLYLRSNSNNKVMNNTFSNSVYGISMVFSSNNNLTNNIFKNNFAGVNLYYGDNNNRIINNTASSNVYAIYTYGSNFDNTIMGGTLSDSSSADYLLQAFSPTNNFTGTNFTSSRKIYFYDSSSWFNYRNDSSELWLKTNVSTSGILNRILNKWSQTIMSWNESASSTVTASYNLRGLLPNTVYKIYNSSLLAYTLTTDSLGNLDFAINLNTAKREIGVQEGQAPRYWNNSTNNTLAGQLTGFSLDWTDNAGLSGYIFSSNNSGYWINDTWTIFASSWSNTTKILNFTSGVIVSWRIYANDSANNWNVSGSYIINTTSAMILVSLNTYNVWWNDSVTAYGRALDVSGSPEPNENINLTIYNIVCNNVTDSSGYWSCTFNAPLELGTYTVNGIIGSIFSNTTTLTVKVKYGETPIGTTDRYVYEQPILIQEPSGRIRIAWARVMVWRG